MLHTSKISLSKSLGVDRTTITRMVDRGEVKEVHDQRGKKVGYVDVKGFIKYLVE